MQEKKVNKFTAVGFSGFLTWLAFASLPIIAVGWLLYKIVDFFIAPDLIPRIIEWAEALGLCFSAVIIFIVAVNIYFKFFPPKEETIDDW